MKLNILLLLSIAILITGCATSQSDVLVGKPIPETVELHPDKYTLRFVRATDGSGPLFKDSEHVFACMSESIDGIFSVKPHVTNEWSDFRFGEATPALPKDILLSKIEQANPTYTELVSIPVEMGKDFSSDNGLLKGKIWIEMDFSDSDPDQNTVVTFELKYDPRPIKFAKDPLNLKVGEWVCLGLGGSNRTEWVLIKLYEPQK
jgi:hypothetical protein